MFLQATKRFKDGKVHTYWSMVENVRVGRRVFQRRALYLGELNDSQRSEWQRAVEAFGDDGKPHHLKLFPEDRAPEDIKRRRGSRNGSVVKTYATFPRESGLF